MLSSSDGQQQGLQVSSMEQSKSLIAFFGVLAADKAGLDISSLRADAINWLRDGLPAILHLDDSRATKCSTGLNFKAVVTAIRDGSPYGEYESQLEPIVAWLNVLNRLKVFEQSWVGNMEVANLLSNIRIYLGKGSDNSWKNVQAKISVLQKSSLIRVFGISVNAIEHVYPKDFPEELMGTSDKELYKKVFNLAKGFGFNEATPPAVSPQKGNEGVNGFQTWKYGYLYLRNKARLIARNLVRANGHSENGSNLVMPVTELAAKLKQSGVEMPLLNPNLVRGELVDENLNIHTPDGKILAPLAFDAEVIYNESYDPNYQDKYSSAWGTMYYLKYKPKFAQGFSNLSPQETKLENKSASFDTSSQMREAVKSKRMKWVADLSSSNANDRMLATILEIAYQAAMRIGSPNGKTTVKTSDGKSKPVKTYGLSVLEKRHVKFNSKSISVRYTGKAAVDQRHLLKYGTDRHYRKALDNLKTYAEIAEKPSSLIFTIDGKPLSNQTINSYVKNRLGLEGATIHKFRHIKAAEIAEPILAKCPYFKKQGTFAEVFSWFKDKMLAVGEKLGHVKTSGSTTEVTAMTAIASYYDPADSAKFFEKCGVVPPKAISALLKTAV